MDAPPSRQGRDEPEPAAADALETALLNVDLEARALVDDLASHGAVVEGKNHPDPADFMQHAVAHEL